MKRRRTGSHLWLERWFLSPLTGSVLLLGLIVTGYGLVVNTSAPAIAAGNPCGDCVSGWMSFDSIFGGRECSHGPDTDNDCDWWNDNVGFGAGCCETEKGKQYLVGGVVRTVPDCTAANACKCFDCQADACEGENMEWMAHCGLRNTPWGAGQTCPLEAAGNGPRRKNRVPDPPPGGFACNASGTGDGKTDYEVQYACGGTYSGGPAVSIAKCMADNCPPSTQPWNESEDGPRNKCKS